MSGSSPLTRGKHYARRARDPPPRLIPAHAGKTVSSWTATLNQEAHPRSRGENTHWAGVLARKDGSSPLTRGKQRVIFRCPFCEGLIPAHAGKTFQRRSFRGQRAAHPRSRGENLAWAVEGARAYGSSPLTRGKPRVASPRSPCRRLIPAHAGKTTFTDDADLARAAHPRSRGENLVGHCKAMVGHGSSPLTRGKLEVIGELAKGGRLIPAHAGKTRSARPSISRGPAHPRSRGENVSGRT